jgi:hypothetical protein
MNDAAIAPGLMQGKVGFFLKNGDFQAVLAPPQHHGNAQSQNATADYCAVILHSSNDLTREELEIALIVRRSMLLYQPWEKRDVRPLPSLPVRPSDHVF